jgi:hypothetical protein
MGKNCPEHVDLILEINKTVIVASSWCSIFTLPTLMMHGQTQTRYTSLVKVNNMVASVSEEAILSTENYPLLRTTLS